VRPRPLPQSKKVLPGVHVPPGGRNENGFEWILQRAAAFRSTSACSIGIPATAIRPARKGRAGRILRPPWVRRRPAPRSKAPGTPCGPSRGERRAVRPHDHDAARPCRNAVAAPCSILSPRSRPCCGNRSNPWKGGAGRSPRIPADRGRGIAGRGSTRRSVRRVSEHAGVQARRLAGIERRAKAGLDPAGDRRLRHQHHRILCPSNFSYQGYPGSELYPGVGCPTIFPHRGYPRECPPFFLR